MTETREEMARKQLETIGEFQGMLNSVVPVVVSFMQAATKALEAYAKSLEPKAEEQPQVLYHVVQDDEGNATLVEANPQNNKEQQGGNV